MTSLNKIEEVYGKDYVIMKESEKTVAGFLGLFPKKEYAAKIVVRESGDNPLTPNDVIYMKPSTKEDTVDLRRESLVGQMKNETVSEALNKDTMDLFMKLKHQLDGIQSFMKESKKEEESPVVKTVREFLENELLEKELIDEIISRIGPNAGVMQTMTVLENFVRECCKEQDKHSDKKIKVFVGTTGVGKTTTIAKITADLVINQNKKVTLFTSDTYRIAAVEQLNTYADIFQIPIQVLYEEDNVAEKLSKASDSDYILVDTAGRSYKNKEQMEHIGKILSQIEEKQTFLVINANNPFQDTKRIIEQYKAIEPDLEVIVTKTDETEFVGNLLNIMYYLKKPVRYVTFGQEVPNDFEVFQESKYIDTLLERIEV